MTYEQKYKELSSFVKEYNNMIINSIETRDSHDTERRLAQHQVLLNIIMRIEGLDRIESN